MLDNLSQIKKLDTQNMLGSLRALSKQAEQVWKQANGLKIPADYKRADKIVVCGMGGSAIGADVIKSVFASELKLPVFIANDYNLPAFVNQQTLVVASSYSGNTEEVESALKQALAKKAKAVVISSGGNLQTLAKKNKLPALIFTTENNPCGSPRMGLGYSVVGQLALLSKLGFLRVGEKEIGVIVKTIQKYETLFGVKNPVENNFAKQLTRMASERSVWYVASEHLTGNAHVAANQMNENGKRFAGYFAIPELNHHLLEGMLNPKSNKENLLFVMFESKLYHPRNQRRYQITKNVLDKNSIQSISYACQERTKVGQMCEALVLSGYASYYSALLAGIDPTPIPFVDFFKHEMSG
ncbi:MAG: SIS domain-containing protein [Candidatus Magasanikbacteria bacterium]|nr:SIS domain-containing protein [Candidatus Magasanikbacteria bacterium]